MSLNIFFGGETAEVPIGNSGCNLVDWLAVQATHDPDDRRHCEVIMAAQAAAPLKTIAPMEGE
jgi:hypothetical protein